MLFMVYLRIDISTKGMLNITSNQKSCATQFVSSIVKFICTHVTLNDAVFRLPLDLT